MSNVRFCRCCRCVVLPPFRWETTNINIAWVLTECHHVPAKDSRYVPVVADGWDELIMTTDGLLLFCFLEFFYAALRKHLKSVAEFDYIDGPIRLNNTSWQDLVAEGGGTFDGNGELSEKAKGLIYSSSTHESEEEQSKMHEQEDGDQEPPLYSWFHFKDRSSPVMDFQKTTETYLDEYIRKNGLL